MRQQSGKNDRSQGGGKAALNSNGFISPRKYYIQGLSDCLRTIRRGQYKKELKDRWGIPARTLNDIERLSAISFDNWRLLETHLGSDFEKLRLLCPEGWGANKQVITKASPISQQGTAIKWKVIQWEVDVRIENARGDSEYQTSVQVQNVVEKSVPSGPMHSIWAPRDSGITFRNIRAYDQEGQLEVLGDVTTPTFLTFRIKARRPVAPGRCWKYWWEVSWPKGYPDWHNCDLTYKGEAPVNELVLKVVLPHIVKPSGQPTLRMPDGTMRNLSWTKLHGRDAIVFWQREVPVSESMKILFQCDKREPRNPRSGEAA
jgi:hypothetical protein